VTRYGSRKFLLTLLFSLAGIVALFVGKLTGDQFIALAGLVLTIHNTSNIIADRRAQAVGVGGTA
jgi:hypothetical protein